MSLERVLTWYFPLARPMTGVALGNGRQGVLVWGGERLHLTVGRAGFWDRRNPHPVPAATTFARVRAAVEAGNEPAVKALFAGPEADAGGSPYPQQIGAGRIEIAFAEGRRPVRARLNLDTAVIEVDVAREEDDPEPLTVRVWQSAHEERFAVEWPAQLARGAQVRLRPVHEVAGDALASLGIAAPLVWGDATGGGFLQPLPADEPLAMAWAHERDGAGLRIATALGAAAREDVARRLDGDAAEWAEDAGRSREWWRVYWDEVPRMELPDETLRELWNYGLFRQAGMIRRDAPAATLQGPWMEDTRVPAWSNDYHFNINVQMVYGAALATGRHEDMRPLWDMLRGWMPRLRDAGQAFFGVEGAMLLPHAVDDRGQPMGSFWAGTIDQACVAWMGHLAWQHYRHTLDEAFLREVAWPLLSGAFFGYLGMLERVGGEDGRGRFSLPVSVSPEFGGSELAACWGRDASFQLAALHATIGHLRAAAAVLGEPEDARWAEVAAGLPAYAEHRITGPSGYSWITEDRRRIALWAGKDLPESHRHHSHLAALYPFCTVDAFDPAHQKTVALSLSHWVTLGAGNWAGWSLPWASALCSRCGLPDAARTWLHLYAEAFTNEGRASLHNANYAGVFGWDDGSLAWPDFRKGADYDRWETMQMDAAMGALNAVVEMLVQARGDTLRINARLPGGWREAACERVRTEGAFEIGARWRHGKVDVVSVRSLAGGPLRLEHGIDGAWTLDHGDARKEPALELAATEPGRVYVLRRKRAGEEAPRVRGQDGTLRT